MRYRLRTLLIVLALGPQVVASSTAGAETPAGAPKKAAGISPSDRTPTRPGAAEKITFDDLAIPGIQANMVFRDFMLSDRARELDGKRVIITGYIYPGASQKGIKEFVLLRQKDCPFGAGGQADHVAQTVMRKGMTADFTTSPVKVEATLLVRPFQGPDENTWSIYRLDDAQIR